jgi:hypothetical protein
MARGALFASMAASAAVIALVALVSTIQQPVASELRGRFHVRSPLHFLSHLPLRDIRCSLQMHLNVGRSCLAKTSAGHAIEA